MEVDTSLLRDKPACMVLPKQSRLIPWSVFALGDRLIASDEWSFRSDNAFVPEDEREVISLMCSYLALCFIGPIDYVRRRVPLTPEDEIELRSIDWRLTPITWPNALETVPWQPSLIWYSERSRYLRALNKIQCVQLIVSWCGAIRSWVPREKERY